MAWDLGYKPNENEGTNSELDRLRNEIRNKDKEIEKLRLANLQYDEIVRPLLSGYYKPQSWHNISLWIPNCVKYKDVSIKTEHFMGFITRFLRDSQTERDKTIHELKSLGFDPSKLDSIVAVHETLIQRMENKYASAEDRELATNSRKLLQTLKITLNHSMILQASLDGVINLFGEYTARGIIQMAGKNIPEYLSQIKFDTLDNLDPKPPKEDINEPPEPPDDNGDDEDGKEVGT